jgi:HD-GYP domain-containing protein (c-di-GMP phosphodiesterase class II)
MVEVDELVGEARERRKRRMDSRERTVDRVSATLFVAVAVGIALFVPSNRDPTLLLVLGLVAGYAVVSRVRFEYGDVYVSPEALVFVPLVLLTPLNLVPLLAAVGGLLATVPEYVRGNWHKDRWVTCIADSWFSVGPVLVLAALAPGLPDLDSAWAYGLALVALGLSDLAWSLTRDKLLQGHSVAEVLRNCLGTNRVSAILAMVALFPTLVAVQEPLVLLSLGPLVWLLTIFSKDRTERYTATLELHRAYRGTVMLLVDVIEFDDGYTAEHSRSVVELVQEVATEIGMESAQLRELEFAALLHDVGKIAIPKEILNKPSALTEGEFEVLKGHTIEGQFMLDRIGGVLGRVGEVVRSCHERWDGTGYPDGLAKDEIPLAARVVFACDAYNAMTTDRPYRRALSQQEALARLVANSGTQFDPEVVPAVVRVVASHSPAMTVPDPVRAMLASAQTRSELRTAS